VTCDPVQRLLVHKTPDHQIEVFCLPSHSPERSPDEYLTADLKAGVHGGRPPRDGKGLVRNVLHHLRMLQHRPDRTLKYFEHPCIRHAAARGLYHCRVNKRQRGAPGTFAHPWLDTHTGFIVRSDSYSASTICATTNA
jgi:hypothetical protein